jgi:hypothetical protein
LRSPFAARQQEGSIRPTLVAPAQTVISQGGISSANVVAGLQRLGGSAAWLTPAVHAALLARPFEYEIHQSFAQSEGEEDHDARRRCHDVVRVISRDIV